MNFDFYFFGNEKEGIEGIETFFCLFCLFFCFEFFFFLFFFLFFFCKNNQTTWILDLIILFLIFANVEYSINLIEIKILFFLFFSNKNHIELKLKFS